MEKRALTPPPDDERPDKRARLSPTEVGAVLTALDLHSLDVPTIQQLVLENLRFDEVLSMATAGGAAGAATSDPNLWARLFERDYSTERGVFNNDRQNLLTWSRLVLDDIGANAMTQGFRTWRDAYMFYRLVLRRIRDQDTVVDMSNRKRRPVVKNNAVKHACMAIIRNPEDDTGEWCANVAPASTDKCRAWRDTPDRDAEYAEDLSFLLPMGWILESMFPFYQQRLPEEPTRILRALYFPGEGVTFTDLTEPDGVSVFSVEPVREAIRTWRARYGPSWRRGPCGDITHENPVPAAPHRTTIENRDCYVLVEYSEAGCAEELERVAPFEQDGAFLRCPPKGPTLYVRIKRRASAVLNCRGREYLSFYGGNFLASRDVHKRTVSRQYGSHLGDIMFEMGEISLTDDPGELRPVDDSWYRHPTTPEETDPRQESLDRQVAMRGDVDAAHTFEAVLGATGNAPAPASDGSLLESLDLPILWTVILGTMDFRDVLSITTAGRTLGGAARSDALWARLFERDYSTERGLFNNDMDAPCTWSHLKLGDIDANALTEGFRSWKDAYMFYRLVIRRAGKHAAESRIRTLTAKQQQHDPRAPTVFFYTRSRTPGTFRRHRTCCYAWKPDARPGFDEEWVYAFPMAPVLTELFAEGDGGLIVDSSEPLSALKIEDHGLVFTDEVENDAISVFPLSPILDAVRHWRAGQADHWARRNTGVGLIIDYDNQNPTHPNLTLISENSHCTVLVEYRGQECSEFLEQMSPFTYFGDVPRIGGADGSQGPTLVIRALRRASAVVNARGRAYMHTRRGFPIDEPLDSDIQTMASADPERVMAGMTKISCMADPFVLALGGYLQSSRDQTDYDGVEIQAIMEEQVALRKGVMTLAERGAYVASALQVDPQAL